MPATKTKRSSSFKDKARMVRASATYNFSSARRAALKKAQAASAAARRKLKPNTNALRVKLKAKRAMTEGRVAKAVYKKSGLKGLARYLGKRTGVTSAAKTISRRARGAAATAKYKIERKRTGVGGSTRRGGYRRPRKASGRASSRF